MAIRIDVQYTSGNPFHGDKVLTDTHHFEDMGRAVDFVIRLKSDQTHYVYEDFEDVRYFVYAVHPDGSSTVLETGVLS